MIRLQVALVNRYRCVFFAGQVDDRMLNILIFGYFTMMDFNSVQNALERLGATTDASESHGTLCGLLLGNSTMAMWLEHTLSAVPEQGDVLAAEQLRILKQLFEQTRDRLNIEDMSLELLLPDDSDDLTRRLFNLASWCQGFLYGITVIGQSNSKTHDEQSRECLSDLLEISKLDAKEVASEETEQQFAEIVEHVRMSVLMLNETLNPVIPAPPIQ